MPYSYYLQTESTDPRYNLAFEEYILRNRTEGNWLILWQNHNSVIIGRNQNALEEINQKFIEEHNIQVVRRNTGGGAVYHDIGNLNYSFITDDDDSSASRFTQPVVKALQSLGLDAQCSGRNDILVSGKKVSGTAQFRHNGRILHHGTLLFDSNPEMISGSLNPDPTKFQSKSVKSVRSRVGNIRDFLPQDMTIHHFWQHLRKNLVQSLVPMSLTQEELEAIRLLQQEKYDTWQWNFGSSPKYETHLRRRFPAGLIQIDMTIRHGSIDSIQIHGDFLAVTELDPLLEALTGCVYQKDAIEKRICKIDLLACLGGISSEEFLETIMDI